MAVKIRLRRMGAKKAPFYRIVVADERTREMADSSKKSVLMTRPRIRQQLLLMLTR